MSSHDSEPAEELRQRAAMTLEFEVGDHVFLKVMLKK